MKVLRAFLLACFFLAFAGAAYAHKPSDSYLAISVDDGRFSGQWDIALRDLDFAIGLDADGNGEITWGEVQVKHAEIAAYAMARLTLSVDGGRCATAVNDHLIDSHSDGAYAVLRFAVDCPGGASTLSVDYRLLFDLDPQHRGLLKLSTGRETQTAIFSPEQAAQQLSLARADAWSQFVAYLGEGVWHIWIGFDHILFLLSLLLPAVLVRQNKAWVGVDGFRSAFIEVVKIVTAFTLAHSITLTLATLEIVNIPSRLTESVIAASIVLAALNNIFPVIKGRRWMVAFAFGLIHGFGFASVLQDLGLPGSALLSALVGFNLGVEAGQLAIVGVFLPLAFALRRTLLYRGAILVGGSSAIVVLACAWLVERAFDLRFMPF